ncbi:general transcription factor 3C polypeptide 5 [Protopterus annectens]|uniref:general transcription factor 3C polypeptide 5 n=1 Tax=Protopterus annectens TaxID=7888 RepID=UPI001CFA27CF|nr:general transcription factor 3C polypeptide 5 [Protopterus annectens]
MGYGWCVMMDFEPNKRTKIKLCVALCELNSVEDWEGYNTPQLSSENLIGLSRARRPHNAIFVNFEDADVPDKPLEAAVNNWAKHSSHPNDKRLEAEVRKLFEARPVWSKNAIKANVDTHPDKLKWLLPCMAYYMITGPWRSLWVRVGYDPRKDPKAKQYQVLDFRIRCGLKYGYSELPVKAKRSTYNYSLPITVKKNGSEPVTGYDMSAGKGPSASLGPQFYTCSSLKVKEYAYVFREGTLPPYRQMFYQLCDLDVESLQKIIHRNDGSETVCTERDGWCLPKSNDDLRDAMSHMIKQTARSQRPALFSTESKETADKEQLNYESGEEEEEEEEYQPSDGSENEMETEILDYM